MAVAEARALCADLEMLDWDDALIARAVDRTTAALLEAAPQVTPAAGAPGTWWVGATGFGALGGERTLLGALLCIARRWHPEARAAVADSCVAAHIATWDERQMSGVWGRGIEVLQGPGPSRYQTTELLLTPALSRALEHLDPSTPGP
jgi:hypothetical protein